MGDGNWVGCIIAARWSWCLKKTCGVSYEVDLLMVNNVSFDIRYYVSGTSKIC